MSLSDSDVADLARQAVDREDPALEIRIDPLGQDDPYRWGAEAWTVSAGGRASYIRATMTMDAALAQLIADLAS